MCALMNNRGVTGYSRGGQVKAPTLHRGRTLVPLRQEHTRIITADTQMIPNLALYVYQQNN